MYLTVENPHEVSSVQSYRRQCQEYITLPTSKAFD